MNWKHFIVGYLAIPTILGFCYGLSWLSHTYGPRATEAVFVLIMSLAVGVALGAEVY